MLSQDIVRSKHSAVLAAFRQYFVKPGLIEIEFSDTFGKAFDLRQKADYDMVLMADQIQVQELIGNARKFTQRILRYLEEGNYL
ncbi:MAG: hypothetical protein MAG431_00285 [Chloroflexi bacterium]|nr:hypothetical protein [Chloroflexota bacterium]